jgi:hypothetical protein
MFVAAAPVTVIARPPLVVSAVSATAHPVGTLKSSIVDLTRTVEAALASRLIAPLISQAPTSVPAGLLLTGNDCAAEEVSRVVGEDDLVGSSSSAVVCS